MITMIYYSSDSLYHHGIKGQKWGLRRFQNEDGSLTPAGKERYSYDKKEGIIARNKRLISASNEKNRISSLHGKERAKAVSEYRKKYGFSYQNASLFGVREANRIGKYAYKKKLSETKATGRYLLKKAGVGLAVTAATSAAMYYAHTHPEQVTQAIFNGQQVMDKVIGHARISFDEFKVRMDPNIVDGKFTSREILDVVGYLPYSAFKR